MKTFFLSIIALTLVACSDVTVDPLETSVINNTEFQTNESALESVKERPNPDNGKKPQPTSIFTDLLIKLKLNAEQKTIAERLLTEHKSCVESCIKELKDAERQIMMNARKQEETIKAKAKSGEITREQARIELRQLRESIDAQLKAIPREKVRECIKSCDEAFIAQLKAILTPEQKVILERWVISRQKRGTTETGKPEGRG